MRVCLALLCACFALCAVPARGHGATPAHASTSKKQAATQARLKKVQQQIATLTARQHQTDKQKHALDARLADQAKQLSKAAAAVRESDHALAANQHQLDQLKARRDKIKAHLASQRDALAALLRAAYRIQPGSRLRLALGQADLTRISRALAYSRYFQRDRIARIRKLLGDLSDLHDIRADITRQRKAIESRRTKRKQQARRLHDARDQQKALLAKAETRLAHQRDKMRQLEHNRDSLQRLLRRLHDVFADIPEQLPSDTPFAHLRGQLPWPARGKTSHRHGGLYIRVKRGTTVEAVAHGRVAYAHWLRGYGLLVVIDHGHGWMSLYGGNESVLRHVGDWVKAGEAIATSGASVGDDSGVYFGLRHRGKAVDPLPWLRKRGPSAH